MRNKLLLSLLLAPAIVITAPAQETTGGVQGIVKDPQGAVVSGATVVVTSPALIGKKTVTTDSSGRYHVEQLPPGDYTITATAPGFGTETQQGLKLKTGALPNVNFDLKIGQTEQTVEVSAQAQEVDVTSSKVSANVTEEILTGIPKGRSFQTVIPFAPGARQEPLQGASNTRNNGFQIDGATDSENVYLQDGVNITNIQNGGVGKNFQRDFIQEVQIKSSSFEAEFGGALGGVINAVPKHGSNSWHGEIKGYWQSSALNANDPCASGFTANNFFSTINVSTPTTNCGQRIDPALAGLSTAKRLDGTPQYYVPKKDNRHILEPGFELGGPLMRDRLWLYTGYLPTLDTTNRTSTFQGSFNNDTPTPQTLTQTFVQHNLYTRMDYRMFNSLNLFGSWNYGYSRVRGALAQPDSAVGQLSTCQTKLCNGTGTDPSSFRADSGAVFPLSVYSFGGDWTPTSKLLISSRFGYFFNNTETRGVPQGIRYVWDQTVNASSTDLNGKPLPSSAFNSAGISSIPNNFSTQVNAFKRKSLNSDLSYFLGGLGGSHNFKTGYFYSSQFNDVLVTSQGPWVNLDWGVDYTPVTSTSACDAIIASNPQHKCQGQFGYFFVGSTSVSNTGHVNATDQAVYFQDSWTVGHTGLTINAGVRMDSENNPAFDHTRFPDLNFGWGQKIAPRIGGAYDLLHNGKVKVYASYGKFFDIMKLGLTRGSFGSDYWHNCVYALDTADYKSIVPTLQALGGCPSTGGAPGLENGFRFIENVDFRATKADPQDPAIQPHMKPVQNHEFTAGTDWAISRTLNFEARYSRKRLDNTIEDMSITDNLGFYIGNPGSQFANILHRPVNIDPAGGLVGPFCSECPNAVPAIRRYDGLEFRLTKQSGANWYGSVSYTYSKLTGNYSGLTDTDPTDGGGGRHSPNNGRAFDLPSMTFLPNGKIDDGPLATDRPHTAKIFGYYRLPWMGQSTWFGVSQALYQGTPISACLPVVGTSSACQWAEGRGNMPILSRDAATGDIVKTGVVHDARTAPFFQTDLSVRHEFRVSKAHEAWRAVLEGNASNILNQHSAVAYYQFVIPTGLISPSRDPRFAGDPGVDWGKVMTAYNYIDALNGTGAFAGVQAPRTLANRFGKPMVFQSARQFILAARFSF